MAPSANLIRKGLSIVTPSCELNGMLIEGVHDLLRPARAVPA